jgi:hypothetical protein
MRMRDIIVGTVVILLLGAVVVWVAFSVYQHNMGQDPSRDAQELRRSGRTKPDVGAPRQLGEKL